MSLIQQIKDAGVVGAGGAGFPAHVKLSTQVKWFLANGAECEPLLHKDRELMLHFTKEIIAGLELAASCVNAQKIAIGIKSKNKTAITALKKVTEKSSIQIKTFDDYYPAGDEYELVYGITGQLIPPAGIPPDIGVVVNNIETLFNIYQASQGLPVTHTFLTITGAVKQPVIVRVPVGSSVREIIQLAGGSALNPFAVMEGGLLMGKLLKDPDQPVTKTTGGLIVLPSDHPLIQRYSKTQQQMNRIGRSACDQCSFCTELCPRYLLGYEIHPHLVMRSLGFSAAGSELWNKYALLCNGCGLCTLYSCPEMLYPRETCQRGIQELRAAGKGQWEGSREIKVHPMKEARRTPLKRLMNRINVSQYDAPALFKDVRFTPSMVKIPLKQHLGNPAQPIVDSGALVQQGQLIAEIPADKLGANVHASISGRVKAVDTQMIIIEKE